MNTLPALLEHTTLGDSKQQAGDMHRARPKVDMEIDTDSAHDDMKSENVPHDEAREILQPRPSTPRRSTEPYSPSLLNPLGPPRPRNRSPYSRAHHRSHSSSSTAAAPPMTRAHSLPSVMNGSAHFTFNPATSMGRPISPLRSPSRSRSPFRLAEDSYSYAGAPTVCDISEDSELELAPRAPPNSMPTSPAISLTPGNTFPRSRRRPASPLHQFASSNPGSAMFSTPNSSAHSSPLLGATRYNEPFPSSFPASLSGSSIPSTPTSTRSRSPSISSLETIPDTPDAEAEALEEDRLDRLRSIEEGPRRSSLDEPTRRINFTNRDKRKRWSVCGGERLDLETIPED